MHFPVSLPVRSHTYAGVPSLNKKRQYNGEIATLVKSLHSRQSRIQGTAWTVQRSISPFLFAQRDFQATVFSGCHDNSDVWFNNSLLKLFIFSEFSVYFIKAKAHICIHKLACHGGHFVGLLFREISLKREEQKLSN